MRVRVDDLAARGEPHVWVARHVAAWISSRRGRGSVIIPSVALTAAGLVVLGASAGPWTLPLAAVLYGLGFGSAQPALQALVVDLASPARRVRRSRPFTSRLIWGWVLESSFLAWLAE